MVRHHLILSVKRRHTEEMVESVCRYLLTAQVLLRVPVKLDPSLKGLLVCVQVFGISRWWLAFII